MVAINYYYYGFVLVATPVKLLGIVPSIAYNFILPTLFAIVGINAFSIGWNLLANSSFSQRSSQRDDHLHSTEQTLEDDVPVSQRVEGESPHPSPFVAGIAASFLTVLLGNLGTIQLLFQRLQQLSAPITRPPTANPNPAANGFLHLARPDTTASAQLNASNASGIAIICACRSL